MAKTYPALMTAGAYNPQQTFNYAGSDPTVKKNVNAENAKFGTQVGQVNIPTPAKDLAMQFPNLAQANTGVSNVINSQLMGQLTPDTINAIKDQGAAWGVASGMPGSGLAANNSLRNIGLSSYAVQNQGIQNYNQTVPTISKTQTVDPSLTADINFQNATNAAAPQPGAAASYAQDLFQKYLSKLSGGGTQNNWAAKNPDGTPLGSTPVGTRWLGSIRQN